MATPREEHVHIAEAHRAFAARYYDGSKAPAIPDGRIPLEFLDQADAAINDEGKSFWDAVRAVERGESEQVPTDQRDHYDEHCGAFAALRTAYEAGEVVAGRRQAGTMVTAEQTYDPETGPPADADVTAQAAPEPAEASAQPEAATAAPEATPPVQGDTPPADEVAPEGTVA